MLCVPAFVVLWYVINALRQEPIKLLGQRVIGKYSICSEGVLRDEVSSAKDEDKNRQNILKG